MCYIAITNSHQCSCSAADRCIVDGRCGSSTRCTKKEIESKGFKTIVVDTFYFNEEDVLVVKGKEPKVIKKKNFFEKILNKFF